MVKKFWGDGHVQQKVVNTLCVEICALLGFYTSVESQKSTDLTYSTAKALNRTVCVIFVPLKKIDMLVPNLFNQTC